MSANRFNKLDDLSRWNRAGLPRFQYVDGDAATWLEELRLAAMGLYARGADFDERLPETWRHRFSEAKDQWPSDAEQASFFDELVWQSLGRSFPDKPETARQRNTRLLSQYDLQSEDYGWEIMRAAARAAHVLLGHLNAFANEGYLRTATQWQNVARLAAMVNHQPAPASSATTTVGLIVDTTKDTIEIDRGLAMKYAPPEGGSPIVFETLSALTVHSDLNTCRELNWDSDPNPLGKEDSWIDVEDSTYAPGSVGAIQLHGGTGSVEAVTLSDVTRQEDETADIKFSNNIGVWPRGTSALHLEPKNVVKGLPRSTEKELVLKLASAGNYSVNTPIKLLYRGTSEELLVTGNEDGHLKLKDQYNLVDLLTNNESVDVETLVPVSSSSLVSSAFSLEVVFMDFNNNLDHGEGYNVYVVDEDGETTSTIKGISYQGVGAAKGSYYASTEGSKVETATVVGTPEKVLPENSDYHPNRIIKFSGKLPKGLEVGATYIQRNTETGTLKGLRVDGFTSGEDYYALQFHAQTTNDMDNFRPDAFEFHGPMSQTLRPEHYNRNPDLAFNGPEIFIQALEIDAQELLRLGKQCLIEDELKEQSPVLATLVEASNTTGQLKLTLEPDEGLSQFKKGWTKINFNAVTASHGETKSPKVLGSGDAEKPTQTFAFKPTDVTFIPSTVAEVGFAPDMDVEVDGVVWTYQDLIDPTATGTDSYSIAVKEDGSLTVHFRRRLPSGTNNVVIRRYRTGVGSEGLVPAQAFTKPQKKHRYVTGITQPFAATGGAEREPVADIKTNAPARLAANGRAVSLLDFERLCRRRSDVWQAKAKMNTNPSQSEQIDIIVVPAEGGATGPTLQQDLIEFVEARAIPGIRIAIKDYQAIKLTASTKVRVDTEAYDKTKVQGDAQLALVNAFSLANRSLGQPIYISEISAALEGVEGVENATVQTFDVTPEADLLRVAKTNGKPSAYFPKDNQLISAQASSAITDLIVVVEPI